MPLFERLVSRSGVKARWVSSEVRLVGASIRLLVRPSLNAWSLIRGGRALQPFVYVFDDASMYLILAQHIRNTNSRPPDTVNAEVDQESGGACTVVTLCRINNSTDSDHFIPSYKLHDLRQRPINHVHDQ